MLGVVLWSDATDRKAVIWCEDQGDLAFMNDADALLEQDTFFDAGDLVQFDMRVLDSKRRAFNPRLVMEQASTALPDVLRDEILNGAAQTSCGAKVVPFARTAPVPLEDRCANASHSHRMGRATTG